MNVSERVDSLQVEIDKKRQEIRSDSYLMSVGEWISLYKERELEIHPEFQRFFRWSDYQKTSLIESILLGIPIPTIFVSQREDGVWDVVDGLQRLSTIYQFVGILRDEKGDLLPPLILEKTKYLPSLAGKKWGELEDSIDCLTPAQRLIIKRSKINVNILIKESDSSAKYELFQRLNTGGSICTPQEVRSCILVSLNPELYRWMKELSRDDNFQNCIALNETAIEEQYDLEILSRFLVLRRINENDLKGISDTDTFFTEKMIKLVEDTDYNLEEEAAAFRTTFELLARWMSEKSFRKYDSNKNKFSGGFLLAPFETIALGIGYNYQCYNSNSPDIKSKVIELWSNSEYTAAFGRGKDARTRLPKLIPLGRKLFAL
jgi:Protein of unknown function DUF262